MFDVRIYIRTRNFVKTSTFLKGFSATGRRLSAN